MTLIQKVILQTFITSGQPMERGDVARMLDDGAFGRGKLAADFCFSVLNQCLRQNWLTRERATWYRLTDEGRRILAKSTLAANNDTSADHPAGSLTGQN
jgi:hypothetical protein